MDNTRHCSIITPLEQHFPRMEWHNHPMRLLSTALLPAALLARLCLPARLATLHSDSGQRIALETSILNWLAAL
jgi:hypothetical protein